MSALLIKAKQKLLEEARRRFESYKNDGSGPIATLSPYPVGLIDAFIDNIELDQNSIVIELGCGDARWMHAISRRFKCACVLGIEIDERRLLDGRRESGEYVMGDFFSCINLSMATHIIFYLSVEGNKRVYEKVLKEVYRILKPNGTLYIKDLVTKCSKDKITNPNKIPIIKKGILIF